MGWNQLTPAMLKSGFWKLVMEDEAAKLTFEEKTDILEKYRKIMKDKRRTLEAQKLKIEKLLERPDEWLEI